MLPVLSAGAAPEWIVSAWYGADDAPTLASCRGRVTALETFQMLCPGCISHGLPQAQRLRAAFAPDDLVVLGLHTVFEHHAVMGPDALEAFLHEYRIGFPVGVDAPGEGPLPRTMELYGLRGTPSLLLFDREGRLRAHHFGAADDLRVGAEVGELLAT